MYYFVFNAILVSVFESSKTRMASNVRRFSWGYSLSEDSFNLEKTRKVAIDITFVVDQFKKSIPYYVMLDVSFAD